MPTFHFTKLEREVLLHRLECDAICDCLACTEADELAGDGANALTHYDDIYEAAYARFEVARRALAERVSHDALISVVTDDDCELLLDAFEGSTYWANLYSPEFDGKRPALVRLHNAIKKKLETGLQREVNPPI